MFSFWFKTASSPQNKNSTKLTEIIWVKVNIVSTKSLFAAAHYRPKEGDVQSAEELRRSIEMVRKTHGNVWILGDFNYPKFSWDAAHR